MKSIQDILRLIDHTYDVPETQPYAQIDRLDEIRSRALNFSFISSVLQMFDNGAIYIYLFDYASNSKRLDMINTITESFAKQTSELLRTNYGIQLQVLDEFMLEYTMLYFS